MSDVVVQTRAITRYFGRACAVDQVTLGVPRGSVFALLGRNGSGKSTLIRMLLGFLEPTRGSATVLGDDSRHLRAATRGRVGYVAEGHPVIDWMRVGGHESFQRSFYPAWDARLFSVVIDHFGLSRRARAGQLSRGQRAGLSLALVLATRPELLVMDDPSLGLDPVARRTLLEAMILVTRDAGHTILFTSHVLEDVERVADHVAVIDRSVLRVCCPVEAFRGRVRRVTLAFANDRTPPLPPVPGLLRAERDVGEIRLTLANPDAATDAVIRGLSPLSVTDVPLSFEDAVVGYLGDRGEHASLLHRIRAAEEVAL